MDSVPPTRSNIARLQDPEQLGLHGRRDVSHLVEEQGAAVGLLEPADLPPFGAGERPPLVAEELALEQCVVKHRTVQRDERLVPAAARGMKGLGNQLLACSGLTQDEHGGSERPDLLDQVEDLPHLRTLGDHRVKAVVFLELFPQFLELVDQPSPFEGPLDEEAKVIRVIRLGQKIVRSGLHRPERIGSVAVGGEHDDSNRDPLGPEAGEKIKAAHVGHPEIGDHQMKGLLA